MSDCTGNDNPRRTRQRVPAAAPLRPPVPGRYEAPKWNLAVDFARSAINEVMDQSSLRLHIPALAVQDGAPASWTFEIREDSRSAAAVLNEEAQRLDWSRYERDGSVMSHGTLLGLPVNGFSALPRDATHQKVSVHWVASNGRCSYTLAIKGELTTIGELVQSVPPRFRSISRGQPGGSFCLP